MMAPLSADQLPSAVAGGLSRYAAGMFFLYCCFFLWPIVAVYCALFFFFLSFFSFSFSFFLLLSPVVRLCIRSSVFVVVVIGTSNIGLYLLHI
jgi:hypothetical protein